VIASGSLWTGRNGDKWYVCLVDFWTCSSYRTFRRVEVRDTASPEEGATMALIDLHPAVERLISLTERLTTADQRLPTPCPNYPISGLITHLHGMAIEFTAAAQKTASPHPTSPPPANVELGELAIRLRRLADAWAEPDAWEREAAVAGMVLPASLVGRTALGEVVLHGWDVAKASDQTFDIPDAELAVLEETIRTFRDGRDGELPGLFAAIVVTSPGASRTDRVLGLAGRDPNWTPSTMKEWI
jgi:uncharacterized protein (TIGR03086 family)